MSEMVKCYIFTFIVTQSISKTISESVNELDGQYDGQYRLMQSDGNTWKIDTFREAITFEQMVLSSF